MGFPSKKEIEMYGCISKLSENSEIICGLNGEVYGCSHKFS